MLREFSPNDFLKKHGLVRSKSTDVLDPERLSLPLSRQPSLKILGTGDWGHGRSGGGSVVVDLDGFRVAKVSLGPTDRDPFEWARYQAKIIKCLSEVSPPTELIIADIDGTGPKPVIIQQKIEGTLVCETPLSLLFSPETLRGLAKILQALIHNSQLNQSQIDILGQKLNLPQPLRFLASCLPFLSDNIMITPDLQVLLTDNTPDPLSLRTKPPLLKIIKNHVKSIIVSTIAVCLLLSSHRLHHYRVGQPQIFNVHH